MRKLNRDRNGVSSYSLRTLNTRHIIDNGANIFSWYLRLSGKLNKVFSVTNHFNLKQRFQLDLVIRVETSYQKGLKKSDIFQVYCWRGGSFRMWWSSKIILLLFYSYFCFPRFISSTKMNFSCRNHSLSISRNFLHRFRQRS